MATRGRAGTGDADREGLDHATAIPAADPGVLARAVDLARAAPVPARAGGVLLGTAGWTDPTLVRAGTFYPRGCTLPEQRLRYYATQFAMVELDSSYYALPSVANARRWAERTPDGFVFDVKAYAALTDHPVDVARFPRDLLPSVPTGAVAHGRTMPRSLPDELIAALWRRFRMALEPLQLAGRLGAVLLQFPPWFTATRGHARAIERCRDALGSLPGAVEFRHASWGEPARFARVISWLRSLELSYVVVDEPQHTPNSMPPTVAVAHPGLAIVRFHGHRGETWTESVSVHEKFGYLYDPPELEPWVERVRQLGASAERVHLVFNNCYSNYAVLGAKDLAALLTSQPPARPAEPRGDSPHP